MGRCANLAIRDVVVEVQRERCSVTLGSHLGARRAEEGVAAPQHASQRCRGERRAARNAHRSRSTKNGASATQLGAVGEHLVQPVEQVLVDLDRLVLVH